MASEKPQQAQCGGCAAPLPWAAIGGVQFQFGTAATKDLCARCTLEYYFRTGGLGGGRRSTGHVTFPLAFATTAAPAPTRCAACRKKVGLLGFACRCGGTFCALHRHADSHGCGFGYVESGRERIAVENPLVAAPKVAKISTERTSEGPVHVPPPCSQASMFH